MSSTITAADQAKLNARFEEYDRNSDGKIELKEVRAVFASSSQLGDYMSAEQIEEQVQLAFNKFNANKDGSLSRAEQANLS